MERQPSENKLHIRPSGTYHVALGTGDLHDFVATEAERLGAKNMPETIRLLLHEVRQTRQFQRILKRTKKGQR